MKRKVVKYLILTGIVAFKVCLLSAMNNNNSYQFQDDDLRSEINIGNLSESFDIIENCSTVNGTKTIYVCKKCSSILENVKDALDHKTFCRNLTENQNRLNDNNIQNNNSCEVPAFTMRFDDSRPAINSVDNLGESFDIIENRNTENGTKIIYACKKCFQFFENEKDALDHKTSCRKVNQNRPNIINNNVSVNNIVNNVPVRNLVNNAPVINVANNSPVGEGENKSGSIEEYATKEGLVERVNVNQWKCKKCNQRFSKKFDAVKYHIILEHFKKIGQKLEKIESKNKKTGYYTKDLLEGGSFSKPKNFKGWSSYLESKGFIKRTDKKGSFTCEYDSCKGKIFFDTEIKRHILSDHEANINKNRLEQTSDKKVFIFVPQRARRNNDRTNKSFVSLSNSNNNLNNINAEVNLPINSQDLNISQQDSSVKKQDFVPDNQVNIINVQEKEQLSKDNIRPLNRSNNIDLKRNRDFSFPSVNQLQSIIDQDQEDDLVDSDVNKNNKNKDVQEQEIKRRKLEDGEVEKKFE